MNKPLVSVIVPAYNEAEIIQRNLGVIVEYMESLGGSYDWELIVVNDGSTDATGSLADEFAGWHEGVRVLHHTINFQLGQALRYAIAESRGDLVVTFDCDLSYDVDHIGRMLTELTTSKAKIVIASPYVEEGRTSNIPFMRRVMSRWANRLLGLTAKGRLTTITGMVRAYDGPFLRSLNLKAMDAEINPEIIYKSQLLRAHITEIPAHLDWTFVETGGRRRKSNARVRRGVASSSLVAFIFRPFAFFIIPGLILLLLSFYTLMWAAIRVGEQLGDADNFSRAVAAAFDAAPHTFIVGGIALIAALQLLSLGIVAMQSKRYFEELFHLGTAIRRHQLGFPGSGRPEGARSEQEAHSGT